MVQALQEASELPKWRQVRIWKQKNPFFIKNKWTTKIEFFSINLILNEVEPLFLCSQSNAEHTYSRNVQVDWETSWRGRGSLGNFFFINYFEVLTMIFKHLPCFGIKQFTYWQIIYHVLEKMISHFDLQLFHQWFCDIVIYMTDKKQI